MNKKFNFYFTKGFKLAFYSMKKCSFFTKIQLCFYSILSLIGKFIFLLRPIFEIADMNLAAFLVESRNVCFPKIFSGVTRKKYVDLLFAEILTDIMIIVCYSIIAVTPIMLMMITGQSTLTLILHYFLAIGGLVPAYLFAINLAPSGFIASKTSDLEVSDFLLNSKATMKGNKVVATLVYVIYGLINLALSIGIYFGVKYALQINVSRDVVGLIIFVIILAVYALYFFVMFRFKMAKITNLYLIYRDSAKLSKSIAVKPVAGENLSYAPLFPENKSDVEKLDLSGKREGK